MLVYYYDYGRPAGMYVSDLLFEVLPYKITMAVFIGFQIMFSLLFAFRLYTSMKYCFIQMTLSVTVCLSLGG